ncbi:SGNH/GDSL hydrolase family protein [Paenibacillus sp. S-38]|uniref:SGNH/GDSL hydrolase family protein n=1 Tax=Paenibacillus sp. S-38 TaxID=3416710 RepID=UPI003CF1C6AE
MLFQPNERLVMIGDSITDVERKRPVGEGRNAGTGKGYVSFVEALLDSVYPELALRVTNMGISGNTVRDLDARWQTDVLDLNPDWVSIMIGINDVWRQFDQPRLKETHVLISEYEATLDKLVAVTLPEVKGIILMTPFYIEPNADDPMRAMMDRYGSVVKRIAAKYGCPCADTQAALEPVLRELYPGALAWDRVHPSSTGHMVLARAFLNTVGFQWK